MITDAALAVLRGTDFRSMVQVDAEGGLSLQPSYAFINKDGSLLSDEQLEALSEIRQIELNEWITDLIARANRTKAELFDEWLEQPDISLSQLLSGLPEPRRSEVLDLLATVSPLRHR